MSLLLVPTAWGGWSVKGAFEPDTVHDQLSGMMTLTPDNATSGPRRVYFNGFGGVGNLATTTLNPNLALVGSSVQPQPYVPVALFGVWKDCNGDGFVGLGDQGLLEYRSALLNSTSVCPPQVPDPDRPGWLVHNDGQWIVEYMPIGYDDVTTARDENPLNLNDTRARVWADWGLPDAPPDIVCAMAPMPHGTFDSTGGLLRWLDCFNGFRGAALFNDAAEAAGQGELGFSDAPPDRPDQSGSPLNVKNPWGRESDDTMVHVFDCDSPTTVSQNDPTGGSLRNIATVPVGNRTLFLNGTDENGRIFAVTVFEPTLILTETGSPAGTVNQTQAGLTDCDRTDADEMVDTDGRRGGSDGDLPYLLEGPNEPVSPFSKRTRTDHALTFEEGTRGGLLSSGLGSRARDDAGAATLSVTGFWVGTGNAAAGRNAYVSRSSLAPEPVSYITYYATVDPSLILTVPLVMPMGIESATYGIVGCVVGTFECDPALWWKDGSGQNVIPRDSRLGVDPSDPTAPVVDPVTEIGVRIGQRYHMRDVDCIDASFAPARAAGAHWGVLTSTACARALPPS